jgi:thiol-disulfide isomerase/thioredoxin
MDTKQTSRKSIFNKVGNWVFIALMVLLIFSRDAKSWLLRQLVNTGLYNAEIKKDPVANSNGLSFLFTGADGQASSTADLKGKVVFVNFWATWCPPCRAEMPSLNALYNQLKDDDRFVFLFINEDDDMNKAKAYLERSSYSLPLMKRVGPVPDEIYSGTLPTTIVLDKKGQVVLKEEGLANYNTKAFIDQLKSLL